MPLTEDFDEARSRLAAGTCYSGPDRYDIAATQAGIKDDFRNTHPAGSRESHEEVYKFLRHVFAVAERDTALDPGQRTEAIGRVMARFAYDPQYSEIVVQQAYDHHEARMGRGLDADPNPTS